MMQAINRHRVKEFASSKTNALGEAKAEEGRMTGIEREVAKEAVHKARGCSFESSERRDEWAAFTS